MNQGLKKRYRKMKDMRPVLFIAFIIITVTSCSQATGVEIV